jgi:hypothetical protein
MATGCWQGALMTMQDAAVRGDTARALYHVVIAARFFTGGSIHQKEFPQSCRSPKLALRFHDRPSLWI